jgi:hypothetical protein
MPRFKPSLRRKGQTLVEFAISWTAIVFPLTMMLVFGTQLLWVWHSIGEVTREGARYAATHCWQPGGANVQNYIRENLPAMPDAQTIASGGTEIVVTYYQRNAETGDYEDFSCEGTECSRDCVPAAVTVAINNYQFQGVQAYFGLPAVTIPNFSTTIPIESAGCGPDSPNCTP